MQPEVLRVDGPSDLRSADGKVAAPPRARTVPAPFDVPATGEVGALPSTALEDASADAHEPPAMTMGSRLGDFTLLARIGRGAQGEVYAARQESVGRLVALKVLSAHLTWGEHALARFRREAEAGGRLLHPGLVAVHTIGEHKGVHFIAQELVPHGRSLATLLEEARRSPELPPGWYRRIAELVRASAEAMHAAHVAGIVHRDVKPGNILITPEGLPKVADFGLALVQDELRLSRSGDMTGTPSYMSPEQAIGARVTLDHRTDVFSLGTTLYEALTLQRPFVGDTRDEVLERIRLRDPVEPRALRPQLPRDLSVICMHALQKRPSWRYATAAALAEDLRRFLAGEAIAARPPSMPARAARRALRHPVALATATVGAVALPIVIVLALDARSARRDTTRALDVAERHQELAERNGQSADMAVSTIERLIMNLAPGGAGQDPDAFRKLLDQGRELVATLGNEPEMQAHLALVLGGFYRDLPLPDEASPLLERALELSDAQFGPGDGRTLRCKLELARLRRMTGALDEARSLCEDVLAHVGGSDVVSAEQADRPDAPSVRAELGFIAKAAGRVDDAETQWRACLADNLKLPLTDERRTERSMLRHVLGQLMLHENRLPEADELLTAAWLDEPEGSGRPEHFALAHTVACLRDSQARAASAANDSARATALETEAESLYRLALDGQRRTLGSRHPNTVTTLANLAVLLRRTGRPAQARPLLDDALAQLDALPDKGGAARAHVLDDLGMLEFSDGHEDEAERLWRGVLADEKIAGVVPTPAGDDAMSSLVALLTRKLRLQEAEDLARELVSRTSAQDHALPERQHMLDAIRQLAGKP